MNGSDGVGRFEEDAATEYEHFYTLIDSDGNPVDGYCYDLHCDGRLRVRAADFSKSGTATVTGKNTTDLVAWLARDGGLRA